MAAIFKHGMKVRYFLSLREIFIFQGLLLLFQHRNIRQAKGTLICRITQIHNLMQAFSLSPQTSFLLWKIHIFILIRKSQEKPTVDSKRKVWEWGKTTQILSSGGNCCPQLNIRCNCFNGMHLNFNMIQAFKMSFSKRKYTLENIRQYQHVLLPIQVFPKIYHDCNNKHGKFWCFMGFCKVCFL